MEDKIIKQTTKYSKLIANTRKKGTGGTSFKVFLSSVWVRDMGLGEEERDIVLSYKDKKIIIEKASQDSK